MPTFNFFILFSEFLEAIWK